LAFHQGRRDLPLLLHAQVSCDLPASTRYHDSSPEKPPQRYSSHAPNRPGSHSRPLQPHLPPCLPRSAANLNPCIGRVNNGSAASRNRTCAANCACDSNVTSFNPLGMNRKRERLPERPKYMDIQTTKLSSNSLNAPQQFVANSISLPGSGSNPTKK
jgi:hypothetical protein